MASEISNENRGVDQTPLKIGIVGAGLVGAAAAIALSRLQNVNVTLFERAAEPRETGAWISLTVTGLLVLNKLIDIDEVQRISYRGDHDGIYVTRHWRTGEIIATAPSSPHVAERFRQARTHRVPLLNTLLSNVPEGTIKYGQSVVDHQVTGDGVRLFFKESDPEQFDFVVAADGLYSKIRRKYVPDQVKYKGSVAYRTIFPESLVTHIDGLPNDSSSWRKDGEIMFLSRLGLGQYGIVAFVKESPEFAANLQWSRSIGIEGLNRLRDHFSSWDPLIGKVLHIISDIDAYPLDSAPWMNNLVREDRIAFVGDAAHPTAGAYGAGAAMGHGDCWALFRSLEKNYNTNASASLERVAPRGKYDLPRALQLYNETRRHFLGRVELQMSLDGRDAQYVSAAADDEKEWIRRFKETNKNQLWMTEHDVEAEFVKTLGAEPYWSQKQRSAVL